ncbi:MAG: putative toxin-antitoxin system toxin component, PIN family [Rhodoferax sp.]|nr:putative toxin-antitoxin system toxin component, PIN family [Rhodoferax sp.]
MQYVLDTNVLVAAVRSPSGASAEIVRRALLRRLNILCSVPLFLEYESVLLRPAHLQAAGVSVRDVSNLLDVLAGTIQAVEIQFLWRPQLRDPADDMVLEVAVNGQASAIVTFNRRDFLPQALGFGLAVLQPAEFLKGL